MFSPRENRKLDFTTNISLDKRFVYRFVCYHRIGRQEVQETLTKATKALQKQKMVFNLL